MMLGHAGLTTGSTRPLRTGRPTNSPRWLELTTEPGDHWHPDNPAPRPSWRSACDQLDLPV